MAKKFHIDANGKVVPCKASIRQCPRTDYSTVEAAQSALAFQQEAERLDNERARLLEIEQHDFMGPSPKRISMGLDLTGRRKKDTIRQSANRIEQTFYETGEYPEMIISRFDLLPTNLEGRTPRTTLTVNSIPSVDLNTATVKNAWIFEIDRGPHQRYNPNTKEKIHIDLDDDFDGGMKRVEGLIWETVRNNSGLHDTKDDELREAIIMKKNFVDAFMAIEDEEKGPYAAWQTTGERYSAFKDSDYGTIRVKTNYETSTFRAASFARFLEDNPSYKAINPEVEIIVNDNENGKSQNAWGIRYSDYTGWELSLTIDGEEGLYDAPATPEETEEYMYKFVKAYMNDNSEETAREKSRYVSDLMVGVENAREKNRARRSDIMKQNREQQAARRANSVKQSKYSGPTQSKTMNAIVNMFT